MPRDRQDKLIDRIYEAAVAPELWSDVLTGLTTVGGGNGALLFSIVNGKMHWIGSPSIVEMLAEYVEQQWHLRTDRADRLLAAQYPGFLNDLDVYSREEMDREPVFTEFLRPRGWGWGAATAIAAPTGDMLIFDVEKAYAHGPVDRAALDRLDRLRPHLARAAMLASRLSMERIRSAADMLALVGLPAAVLGAGGRPLVMNALLEAFLPGMGLASARRLHLADTGADRLLAITLAGLDTDDGGAGRSIPVRARGARPAFILHLIPIRGVANDLFSGARTLLLVTTIAAPRVPATGILQCLFDLTPAEAAVARAIASGCTARQIAAHSGRSVETVRTQLKSVLGKAGLARQGELVALLGSASLPASEYSNSY